MRESSGDMALVLDLRHPGRWQQISPPLFKLISLESGKKLSRPINPNPPSLPPLPPPAPCLCETGTAQMSGPLRLSPPPPPSPAARLHLSVAPRRALNLTLPPPLPSFKPVALNCWSLRAHVSFLNLQVTTPNVFQQKSKRQAAFYLV